MIERREEERMQTASFTTASLEGPGAGDLENALTALSGVAQIDVDLSSSTVSVEDDPAFTNEKLIADMIKSAGYAGGDSR